MKKIIVTGGFGFIGSHLIRLLLAEDDLFVINLDAVTYAGNPANLHDLRDHPRYLFVKGDIADKECVERVVTKDIDSIINLAAESHVDRSIQDASPFVRTNVNGTLTLLNCAKSVGIRRFVQVSTDEVYGSLGATGLFTEQTPLAPNSPYSASKAGADLMVRSYHHTFGMNTITTRCSNNYGPYQFPEKLIPLFVCNLLEDKSVPVYGDGQQVRDWIHVTDHVKGIIAAWKKGQSGEVYNFGGENEWPNLKLTKELLRILGKPESLIRYVQDRPGHDRRYAIDCSKSKHDLGWMPEISFETGLSETVQWYQRNQSWVNNVRTGEYRQYLQKQYGSS